MKNPIKSSFYIVFVAILLLSCGDEEPGQPIPTTLEGKIDLYLENNQASDQPGMSIAVLKDGQVNYQKSKGIARFDADQEINNETQFRIGSISKPMTALAIMQLVEEGLLHLDDSLLSFLPELPLSFEGITIKHLLSHRSGLLDYIEDNDNLNALDNLNMADALSFISHPNSGFQNLEFEPGTMGRYSNTGYVLLALILERVTSETLPDYLQENIFLPAGMTNTFVISEEKHLNDAGENYALSLGNSLNVLGFNSLIYGASGVASSSNDLTRFVQSLLEYRIVSQETLDLMIQTQGSVPNIETDYGLGWLTGTGNFWHTGRITSPNDFWHSGGFDGYRTVLSINPDLNLQIIVLTNGGRETEEHMWKVVELVRKHYI